MKVITWINSFFLHGYSEYNFVIRQKAKIFLWFGLISVVLLTLVSLINLTTAASSHPFLITGANLVALFGFVAGLILLKNEKFDGAIFLNAITLSIRILSGCFIKMDVFVKTGTNNNIYFLLIIMAFVMLFGNRLLQTIIAILLILLNIVFIVITKVFFNVTDLFPHIGSSINVIITIVAVYTAAFLVSRITENALIVTVDELDKNKKLSNHLNDNVQELQVMYEEMEAMNEELQDSSEEILKTNRELNIFKEFAEESTQGFAMVDLDGIVIYTNAAMRKIVKYKGSNNASGADVFSFYPKDFKNALINEIVPQVETNTSWSGEFPFVDSNGESISTLQNVFKLKDDNGNFFAYANIVTDITQRKNLEAQLLQSQKMEAIGRLSGGIAHDFNNYLTAITGYSGLLLSRFKDDEAIEEIEEILKAAQKSSALTRQLLTFSKKQMLRPVYTNINNEVLDIKKMLSRIIDENIHLEIDLENNLNSIYIDPVQVEQIILNLTINSRDAMPDGGTLIIKTQNVKYSQEEALRFKNAFAGEFVQLTITDNGTGIADESIDNIFEPFFTTKEVGKGTGLGLSVVYYIIQQQNGWISVESEFEKGTTIDLFFPAVKNIEYKKNEERKPIEEFNGNGENILVVEDQEEVRKFTVTALTKYGYQVDQASTVFDALKFYNKDDKKYDLILSDIKLPDKTGLDLIEEIINKSETQKFLLSSGYSEKELLWDKIVEQNYPFLPKPYSLYELLEKVFEIINN